MEENKKVRNGVWVALIIIGLVFVYLALLNTRYLNIEAPNGGIAFDKWKREYVK